MTFPLSPRTRSLLCLTLLSGLFASLSMGCTGDWTGTLTSAHYHDDMILPPADAELETRQGELRSTQVVYVNFEGVTVRDCPDRVYCSDAPNNQSSVIRTYFGESSITWQAYRNAEGRRLVVEELEKAYAPYDVKITTRRPASGSYTMLIVATNDIGAGLGVAPLDCGNRFMNDIAYVMKADQYTPQVVANAAVHEIGHSFGLTHVTNRSDYMFFQALSALQRFTRSNYDEENSRVKCMDGNVQDAHAMLVEALGIKPFNGYFADDDGNPHERAIDAIAEAGITGGCEGGERPRFCPDDSVTRAQMAVFLTRALNLPPSPVNYFDDDNGAWYEDAANRLAHAGITSGCSTRKYCGSDNVTRAQMAVFLTRAFNLPATAVNYFDDDNGSWYEDAANSLAAAGVTSGCAPRRYCGNEDVTRAQMATFLARALNLI